MAKDTQPAFFFGPPSSVEIEDGDGSTRRVNTSETSNIPYAEDEEISDDDLKTDSGILAIPSGDQEEEEEEENEEEEVKPHVKRKKEDTSVQQDPDSDSKDEDEEEVSSINEIARDLVAKGVISPREGFDYEDSDIGLANLVEHTIEARILEDVPEEYRSILDAIKEGIPASEWANMVAPDEELRNADLDDEETQEIIVERAYKARGLSDEQIAKKIKRFKATDSLKEEAEDEQGFLIKLDEDRKSKANKEIQDRKLDIEKQHKEFVQDIYKRSEKLDQVQDVFLNKKTRKELADYITKPVNANGHTQYMIDRNDPDIILQAAFLVKNAKNNTLSKAAASKATKTLKEKLDQKTDNLSSSKGKVVRETLKSSRMPEGMFWEAPREIEN